MLRSLSRDMDALMRDLAATVDQLGGATTPREVIAAGVGDAWNQLGGLRRQYDDLRQAQQLAMDAELARYQSNYLNDPHANDAWIADLDTIFPDWRDKKGATRIVVTAIGTTEPDPRPWPVDDPTEQLVWLASNAQVWIPTHRQLDELHANRRAKAAAESSRRRTEVERGVQPKNKQVDVVPGPLW